MRVDTFKEFEKLKLLSIVFISSCLRRAVDTSRNSKQKTQLQLYFHGSYCFRFII